MYHIQTLEPSWTPQTQKMILMRSSYRAKRRTSREEGNLILSLVLLFLKVKEIVTLRLSKKRNFFTDFGIVVDKQRKPCLPRTPTVAEEKQPDEVIHVKLINQLKIKSHLITFSDKLSIN